MSRGGVRTVGQEHECAWPPEQGLGREAWVVICVQQRHHPHVKFKPAHRAGQSFCLRFNSTFTIPNANHNCNLQSEIVVDISDQCCRVMTLFDIHFCLVVLYFNKK